MNEIDRVNELNRIRKLNENYAATPDFGTGSLLMRPEDTSIQGASEDFMGFLQDPLAEVIPPAAIPMRDGQQYIPEETTSAPVAPIDVVKSPVQESTKPQGSGSTPPTTPSAPTALPQEDILSQLKAARAANEAAMLTAKQADSSTDLGNTLMRSGSKLAEALANRSGNTNIKLEADQAAAKEVETTGASNKSRLDALMQDYGIKKGLEDTKYSREKDVTDRKDRLNARAEEMQLRRDEMNYKKQNDAQAKTLAKEEVKEGIQIKKENRKVRREMEDAENTIDAQLKATEKAYEEFKKYSAKSIGGTGSIATLGGLTSYVSKNTEGLKNTFSRLALDEMTTKLKGFGGAVNSEGERKIFETTLPQVGLDDDTNINNFESRIQALKDVKKKVSSAKSKYDRTGEFTQPEEKQSTVAPKAADQSTVSNEVERKTKDDRVAIYDSETKQFLRYK